MMLDFVFLQCPECKNWGQDMVYLSITIHESILWSDGNSYTFPHYHQNSFVSCPYCEVYFWKKDAEMINRDNNLEKFKEIEKTNEHFKHFHDEHFFFDDQERFEYINFLNSLLKKGFANTVEREIELRFGLWHKINDLVRYEKSNFFQKIKNSFIKKTKNEFFEQLLPLRNENFEKLLSIFDFNEVENQLFAAEIYREMKNFTKAQKIIEQIPANCEFKPFLETLKKLIAQKNCQVAKIE